MVTGCFPIAERATARVKRIKCHNKGFYIFGGSIPTMRFFAINKSIMSIYYIKWQNIEGEHADQLIYKMLSIINPVLSFS